MTVTMIGFDYAGVPSVKITKGNIDPVSTPDSNVGAFFYNSKWAADVKVNFTFQIPYEAGQVYYPAGSNQDNYLSYTTSATGTGAYAQRKFYRRGFFPASPYAVPLFDIKSIRISNGRFIGDSVNKVAMTGYQQRGTRWASQSYSEVGFALGYQNKLYAGVGTIDGIATESFYENRLTAPLESFRKAIVTWRLPGDETAIVDGDARAPVVGQNSIYISSGGTFVAKPGFEVFGATETQLAFDTTRVPAKIVAGDDIAIPVGVTQYDMGFPVPAGTVADVFYYDGGVLTFPCSVSNNPYGAEYWFDGQFMFFNNTTRACRARFIVISYDGSAQTSGNNNVLRQFTWNGQNVVQFLKPGASDNPSFADIALDSRWPCLQILAQGTLGIPGDGHQAQVVNFNGDGVFPIVKYMTLHGGVDNTSHRYNKAIRRPYVAMIGIDRINSPLPQQVAGDCTFCEVSGNSAVFHTYRGLPVTAQYNNLQQYEQNQIQYTYDNSIYGIRYYIMGIPVK